MKDKQGEPGYTKYLLTILFVAVAWGVVPGLAQLGGLGGDVTTLYVNWIAVITLAVILTVRKEWQVFRTYKLKDYRKLVGLGIVWPFIYSVTYFQSVKELGAGFTTVLNYTWPLFFILISMIVYKKDSEFLSKSAYKYIIPVLLVMAAVPVYMYDGTSFLFAWPIVFGLVAAVTQAIFSFFSGEKPKLDREGASKNLLSFSEYNPWTLTFIVEVVTAVLVTVVVALSGNFVIPSLQTLGYLTLIGAVSNGIAFSYFVQGSALSAKMAEGKSYKRDPLWL